MTLLGDYGPDKLVRNDSKSDKMPLSIHEALRAKPGPYTVEGMLVSLSPVYKMISEEIWTCANCNEELIIGHVGRPVAAAERPTKCAKCGEKRFYSNHEYINALAIELKDQVPVNELESLKAMLFDKNTESPRAGEIVTINGIIQVENSKGKLVSVLQVISVRYRNRAESTLINDDIESFEKFANMPQLRQRLIAMTALPIINHERVKMGLLRSLVGGPLGDSRRGRIHSALVGDRGTAKSALAREATKMIANSRYVTAQNASGKSMTAIVDKANDTATLRLGPVPLAKGSVCAINEAGLMDPADQGFLLDVLEEGRFTLSKHGITAEIDSPTTLILTANQLHTEWKNPDAVSDDEIPLAKTVLDRIDQIYIFRDSNELESAKTYALKKSVMDKRAHRFNYNFIRKYLQHCRTINPELTPEAETMLNEFWIGMKTSGRAGPRALEALKRMAKAQARLYLKDLVSVEIAKEVMDDYSEILADYGRTVAATRDPRQVTYDECLEILKALKWPITFEELIKTACEKNELIVHYLIGEPKLNNKNGYKLRANYKLRAVLDMLLNHSCVKEIQQRPITLKWVDDV